MRFLLILITAALAVAAAPARAALGLTTVEPVGGDLPVTVFYPTATAAAPQAKGPFRFDAAPDAAPAAGNNRLIVISHGSGGSAWVHVDLARALVDAGYVVALPAHRGDTFGDNGEPGPPSWRRRPAEVSRAIDAVGADRRFAPLLKLDRVGVWGGSAGGHTVLTLAGGRWSPALFARHCDADLAADFQSCVGLFTQLTGGALDGVKLAVARAEIRRRFAEDAGPYTHTDARIAALVAMVPAAADFDFESLARPRVPLGLVTAAQDRWLVPRFHGDAVLAVCKGCEVIARLQTAGHGAMLSPHPPGLEGLVGAMLNDPPGFDRAAELPALDRRVVDFFDRHLRALH
jgi:predicted dienelactone hydrolase